MMPAHISLRGLGRVASILALIACCALFPVAAASARQPLISSSEPPAPATRVSRVDGVSITVSDLDRSVRFFSELLDFREISRQERSGEDFERLTGLFGAHARSAVLALGSERIELVEYRTPAGRPVPPDARSNDRSFQHIAIVVSDMERAFERIRASSARFSSTLPQTLPSWNSAAGGIKAFYFKDPDNHALELIWFPPGKGDPRWQSHADRLFLGIDHTAIAVADTSRSLRFYRDLLGLSVAGESENYGVEQEHLNAVFGAHLRITGLRAPDAGIGIEFLEYIAPATGRDAPLDTTPADLWHWHILLRTQSPINDRALVAARVPFLSAGPRGPGDARTSLLILDPDRHAVLLSGPSDTTPHALREPAPMQVPHSR